LGHRGRNHDPLYRIRKLLLTGSERLDERGADRILLGLRVGDLHIELLEAPRWPRNSVRDVYLADTPADAATLLDKAIVGSAQYDVPEARSLGKTLAAWRTEILAHHDTGASNGPAEGLNCASRRSSAAATASDTESTTDCESYSTPAASSGLNVRRHHASEPALPTQTRRAAFATSTTSPVESTFPLHPHARAATAAARSLLAQV
jgi:hypothetical protein